MHDVLIRGGKIVDGTGKPAFTGDVAIAKGRDRGRWEGPRQRQKDGQSGWSPRHPCLGGCAYSL